MSTLAGAWPFDANGSPLPNLGGVTNGVFSSSGEYLRAMRQIESEPEYTPQPAEEPA